MLTALKGNIIEALSPDILGIHPSSYLVLEDGRVEGIYPTLPENMAETAVEDFGDALILQSFSDMTPLTLGRSIASLPMISSKTAPPGWPCSPPCIRTAR